METTTITLHPQDVDVLLNGRVVGVVEATARSLGEQFGIDVIRFGVVDKGVEVELWAEEVIAVGFAVTAPHPPAQPPTTPHP